jgi:hypothetical protein
MCRRSLKLSPVRLALTLTLVFWSSAHAVAKTPHNEDIAGAMAFLLRVHEGACPGISFDPFEMSKMIDPKGLSLQAVKRKYAKDFDQSYKEAGSRIAGENLAAYCDLVRTFFGKNPGEFPGLVIH